MNLDFPEIVAPAEPPAQAPAAAVADELVDRADVRDGKVLVTYSRTEAALTDLRTRYAGATFDLTTTKGDKAARSARQELVTLRTGLEKKRLELKRPAMEFGKKIDAEAERIAGQIRALEKPIDEQIVADEKRREKEAAERKLVDDARKKVHTDNIAKISAMLVGAEDKSAERLAKGVTMVDGLLVEGFEEFQVEAEQTRSRVLATLKALHEKAVDREAAAKLLADQKLVIDINALAMTCLTLSAEQIRERLDMLNAASYAPDTAEIVLQAHNAAGVQMSHLLIRAEQAEKQAAELEALRAAQVPAQVPAPVPPAPAPQPAPAPVEPVVQDPPRVFDRAADVTPTNAELDAEVDESARVLREDEELEARFGPLETAEGDAQPAAPAVVLAALANALPTHRVEALGDPLLLADVRSLVDDLMEAFRGKYPTQPKMGVDWWAGIRAKAELLQLQIGGAQ